MTHGHDSGHSASLAMRTLFATVGASLSDKGVVLSMQLFVYSGITIVFLGFEASIYF